MLKRLEQEAIRADLMTVEAILARRTPEVDPVGWFQFSRRKSQLEEQLAQLEAQASGNSIALLFGGQPVVGSHGIAADFSAAMISHMQSLVSVQSASLEGILGERGPIPQRENSQMFITDVARGSFGFVLENTGQTPNNLAVAMEDVCDLLARLGSAESERFDVATESVDNRILAPLKNFFKTLDEDGATLRLVSDKQDVELGREAVERARQRIETLQVSDPYPENVIGRVFTMPDSRRFELFPVGGAPVIKGSISVDFVREMFDRDFVASGDFNGKVMRARLRVRETRLHSEAVRKSYQLIGVDPVEAIGSEENRP